MRCSAGCTPCASCEPLFPRLTVAVLLRCLLLLHLIPWSTCSEAESRLHRPPWWHKWGHLTPYQTSRSTIGHGWPTPSEPSDKLACQRAERFLDGARSRERGDLKSEAMHEDQAEVLFDRVFREVPELALCFMTEESAQRLGASREPRTKLRSDKDLNRSRSRGAPDTQARVVARNDTAKVVCEAPSTIPLNQVATSQPGWPTTWDSEALIAGWLEGGERTDRLVLPQGAPPTNLSTGTVGEERLVPASEASIFHLPRSFLRDD